MNRIVAEMTPNPTFARTIPPVLPGEAVELERAELTALLAALESLPDEGWRIAVSRSGWDVHALVAQLAGSYAAQASFTELRRQTSPRLIRFYRFEGESFGETLARIRVGDRRHRRPDQLIAELRAVGTAALERRALLVRPLDRVGALVAGSPRLPSVPLGPFRAVRELWLARSEVAEAAGVPFTLDTVSDGRVVAELVRGLAKRGDAALGERAVDLAVSSEAGGAWRFGQAAEAEARIVMEPRVVAMLLAGRRSPAGIRERSRVEGDVKLAMRLLDAIRPDRGGGGRS